MIAPTGIRRFVEDRGVAPDAAVGEVVSTSGIADQSTWFVGATNIPLSSYSI